MVFLLHFGRKKTVTLHNIPCSTFIQNESCVIIDSYKTEYYTGSTTSRGALSNYTESFNSIENLRFLQNPGLKHYRNSFGPSNWILHWFVCNVCLTICPIKALGNIHAQTMRPNKGNISKYVLCTGSIQFDMNQWKYWRRYGTLLKESVCDSSCWSIYILFMHF